MELAIVIPTQTVNSIPQSHQEEGASCNTALIYIREVANDAAATNIQPYISPIREKTGLDALLQVKLNIMTAAAVIRYIDTIIIKVCVSSFPRLSGHVSLIMLYSPAQNRRSAT